MTRLLSFSLLVLCVATPVAAQTAASPHTPKHNVRAVRAARPPVIDGSLSDEVWSRAEPISAFTQREPDEGRPPTERTELRVLYDDVAIYVSARMDDGRAAEISRRLSSRDEDGDGDKIGILFDPRHDHQTGALFVVSAAGVQRDETLSNDTNSDVRGTPCGIRQSPWTAVAGARSFGFRCHS